MKRKEIVLIIALISVSTLSFSQEIKTLFSRDSSKTKTYGGYGGPLLSVTQINKEWGVLIGGKGGFIINQQFVFGGIGVALVSDNNFIGDNLNGDTNASLDLVYGGGGLFFEYLFNLTSPVHLSVPLNIMAGEVSVKQQNDLIIESSNIFILEPGVNLEFNFAKYFISGLSISYRQVFGSSLKNISNQDFSGINIGLVFKFGYF